MEFLQSKVGKLFVGAFVLMFALTIGAMKMGSTASSDTETTQEEITEETQAAENPEETQQEGEAQQGGSAEASVSNSQAYQNGKKAANEGDLRSAIKYFNIASHSEDTKTKSAALGELANIYMQYNDSKMIIETLEKRLEIEQDKEIKKQAYTDLAETYKYLETYDKAIEMYQESYKLEKTPHDVLRLCEIYEKLHDDDSIRNQIFDYLSVHPNEISIFNKYSSYLDQPPVEEQEYNPAEQKEFGVPETPEAAPAEAPKQPDGNNQ